MTGADDAPFHHYGSVGHLLRRAHQIHSAALAEHLAPFDLTTVQFAVLDMVRRAPGIDATLVSEMVALDRSTLGAVLDRVVAKAWLERMPNPADGRAKLLFLTRKGVALMKRIEPEVEAARAGLRTRLPPEEWDALTHLLQQFCQLPQQPQHARRVSEKTPRPPQQP